MKTHLMKADGRAVITNGGLRFQWVCWMIRKTRIRCHWKLILRKKDMYPLLAILSAERVR